ncbi:sulfotransferase domain-containing protein [Actinomadura keratinilytica]|uniref:sulfotransferase domain-containing protein n=1 Tax=Actinomadura keratinilytica TaxID=547461 RepID=UPI0031EE4101
MDTTLQNRTRPAHRLRLLDDVPPPAPPPPIPPGWRTGPPDFVGVGTMKSGTTWWWSVLTSHPAIASPRAAGAAADPSDADPRALHGAKEVHFFDHYGRVAEVDPAEYHRYFPRPPGAIAGEWTPRYMYDFWTPPMLRAAAPQARLLVLLRDPLARLVSALGFHRALEAGHSPAAVMEHQFHRALYWQQLRMLMNSFDRDRILVLQYERCVAEPERQARRTFEFIGVDPDLWRPVRPFDRQVGRSSPKPVVDEATRAAFCRAIAPDIGRLLRDFPDIDPALWPSVDLSSLGSDTEAGDVPAVPDG